MFLSSIIRALCILYNIDNTVINYYWRLYKKREIKKIKNLDVRLHNIISYLYNLLKKKKPPAIISNRGLGRIALDCVRLHIIIKVKIASCVSTLSFKAIRRRDDDDASESVRIVILSLFIIFRTDHIFHFYREQYYYKMYTTHILFFSFLFCIYRR